MKGRTRDYAPTEPAFLLGVLVVLLLESIDTTGSVHQALLASIEGVTRRTDLYVHLILCRHRFEPGPACTDDLCRHIFGMNPLLHILLQQFGQARVDKAKRGTHEGPVSPLKSHPILRIFYCIYPSGICSHPRPRTKQTQVNYCLCLRLAH